jgi:hypothetical protein
MAGNGGKEPNGLIPSTTRQGTGKRGNWHNVQENTYIIYYYCGIGIKSNGNMRMAQGILPLYHIFVISYNGRRLAYYFCAKIMHLIP